MDTITTNSQDIERALRTIITAIGEDPEREGVKDTPNRIMRMFKEIFRGYDEAQKPKITTFSNDAHSSDMICDNGDFYSVCEHHMMPFFGQYHFAYIPNPNGKILGISKVARVVGYCAARLQLQERLGHDIVNMLSEALDGEALGFAIVIKGRHMCKSMRGVKNNGPMCTTYYTGKFKEDAQLRNEFLLQINQSQTL